MISENEAGNARDVAESITALWEPLTEEQRQYLVDNIEIRQYQKNEVLYRENDEPQYLMCLLEGKVKVYKDGAGGRNQIIRAINEKSLFGYRPAFVGENYHTGAAAICTLSAFAQEKLIGLDGRKIKLIQAEDLERISQMG